jgi:type IV pilus assembly protein PilY1
MIIQKIRKGFASVAFSALITLLSSQSAFAAPGSLATAPLFVTSLVEPNVFFTHDDSGSMSWNTMVKNGTAGFYANSGVPYIDSRFRFYYHPDWYNDTTVLPPSNAIWAPGVWVLRNHNGNKNYYNPATTYTPWAGIKADGTQMYGNADPTAAVRNPNSPTGTNTNLTTRKNFFDNDNCGCWLNNAIYLPSYHVWNDTDGDGVIEVTDANSLVEISAGTTEMQNFANWFVYYRNRDYAAKAAIGRVINSTDATRMGLEVFNGPEQKDLKTMTNVTFKREMLEQFYNIVPGGGTPARNTLKRVGELFKTTGASAPISSQADGGECQQNFNIVMTDGFWNGGDPGVGNTDVDAGASSIFDGNKTQSNDNGNYADGFSNTLADVAMEYYENDLRTDLADNVPTTDGIDESDKQHLVTYTIAFGLNGSLDPNTVSPLDAGFTWPEPIPNQNSTVDDLWHAAYNGRGKYLNAQNPDELEQSLLESISDIAERTATASAVAVNSVRLTTSSVVYLAEFNTNRWEGNLYAYKIIDLTLGTLASTPSWGAGTVLTARDISAEPRVILTYDNAATTPHGVAFQWANLNAEQIADLSINPAGNVDTDITIAQKRLNYLRGSRADEGTGEFFRVRASLLGDIVNSGPVFVGAPDLTWPDTKPFPTAAPDRYSDFKNGGAKTRNSVVYAGANDGMLHGFSETLKDAAGTDIPGSSGKEVLAYIPSSLFSSASSSEGLHYLTDQRYQHKYYNDLTPSVSDIYADLGTGPKWNTILINGLRGGGRGIYALNVTDPTTFSEENAANIVLWEFNSTHDADLGYTYSHPQIGMINDSNGNGDGGSWVAIFGNGYNDTGDGKAKLFVLKIIEGIDGTWSAGDYFKIDTGAGSPTARNGLATPALADTDGNGTVDRVYAGDLQGNMWAFDLSDPSNPMLANNSTSPLFVTKGNRPITAKPTLAKHPTESDSNSNEPNIMVYFGSGQYLVNADKTTAADNHFYGAWDKGFSALTNSNLIEQTFRSGFTYDHDNDVATAPIAARVLTQNTVDYAAGKYGWFLELPDVGERSITRPAVRDGSVFFNTFVPASDPCSIGGFGYRMVVDATSGGATSEPQTDTNDDGLVDDKDTSSDSTGVNPETPTIGGTRHEGLMSEDTFTDKVKFTNDDPTVVKELPRLRTGRFSWQELLK